MTNRKSSSALASDAVLGLAEQSERVVEEVQQLGRVALESATEAASALRERGRGAVEEGRDRAVRAKGQLDDYVMEHPTKSLLIALGLGAVLALFLNRRS